MIAAPGLCAFWYNILLMKRFALFTLLAVLSLGVQASWYWPFGSEDGDEPDVPRISELMEPASLLIDEASDLAAE